MADKFKKEVVVEANTKQAKSEIKQTIALADKPIELKVDAEIKDAAEKIKTITELIQGLTKKNSKTGELQLTVGGIGKIQRDIEALQSSFKAIGIDGVEKEIKIADTGEVKEQLNVFGQMVDILQQLNVAVQALQKQFVGLHSSLTVSKEIDQNKASLDRYIQSLDNFAERSKRSKIVFGETSSSKRMIDQIMKGKDPEDIIKNRSKSTASKFFDVMSEAVKSPEGLSRQIEYAEGKSASLLDIFKKLQEQVGFLKNGWKTESFGFSQIELDQISQIEAAIKAYDTIAEKQREYEEALQREASGSIKVNVDSASIKELSDAIGALKSVINVEDGATLGIDKASIEAIKEAMSGIKDSFSQLDVGASFKPEQIEQITTSFTNLQEVLQNIHDLLLSLDIPRIETPEIGDGENKPRQERRSSTVRTKTTPTGDGGTRTVTHSSENSSSTGGTSGVDGIVEGENRVQSELRETREEAEQTADALDELGKAGSKPVVDTKALDEAEYKFKKLVEWLKEYQEAIEKSKTGDWGIVRTDEGAKFPRGISSDDIRMGKITKASIKRILGDYLKYKTRLDTGKDELGYTISEQNQAFNRKQLDSTFEKLSKYVYAYNDMEEAAKLFGKTHQDIFQQVVANIEKAKIANEAYDKSDMLSRRIVGDLGNYGVEEISFRQIWKELEPAMATGDIEKFAEVVQRLFGVTIPTSAEKAREAIASVGTATSSMGAGEAKVPFDKQVKDYLDQLNDWSSKSIDFSAEQPTILGADTQEQIEAAITKITEFRDKLLELQGNAEFSGLSSDMQQNIQNTIAYFNNLIETEKKQLEIQKQMQQPGGSGDSPQGLDVDQTEVQLTDLEKRYQKIFDTKKKIDDLLREHPNEDVYHDETTIPDFDRLMNQEGLSQLLQEFYNPDEIENIIEKLKSDFSELQRIENAYYEMRDAMAFDEEFSGMSFERQLALFDEIAKGSKAGKQFLSKLGNEYLEISAVLQDGKEIDVPTELGDPFKLFANVRDQIKSFKINREEFDYVDGMGSRFDTEIAYMGDHIASILQPITQKIHQQLQEAFKIDDSMLKGFFETMEKWQMGRDTTEAPFWGEAVDKVVDYRNETKSKLSNAFNLSRETNAPQELIRQYNDFWDQIGEADSFPTIDEMIASLNQKAQELGVTFDETSKKWVQLATAPEVQPSTPVDTSATEEAVAAEKKQEETARAVAQAETERKEATDAANSASATAPTTQVENLAMSSGEAEQMNTLGTAVSNVTTAVDAKNEALKMEGQIVDGIVQQEINSFDSLLGEINFLIQDIEKLNTEIANIKPIDLQLAKESNSDNGILKQFKDIQDTLQNLSGDTLKNTIDNLNSSLQETGNISEKIGQLKTNLTELFNAIKDFGGQELGDSFSSLVELVSHVDELKNIATILNAAKNDVEQVKQAAEEAAGPSKDKYVTMQSVPQGSERWQEVSGIAAEYLETIGKIYNVEEQIRRNEKGEYAAAYRVTGEKGSMWLGANGEPLRRNTVIQEDYKNAQKEIKEYLAAVKELNEIQYQEMTGTMPPGSKRASDAYVEELKARRDAFREKYSDSTDQAYINALAEEAKQQEILNQRVADYAVKMKAKKEAQEMAKAATDQEKADKQLREEQLKEEERWQQERARNAKKAMSSLESEQARYEANEGNADYVQRQADDYVKLQDALRQYQTLKMSIAQNGAMDGDIENLEQLSETIYKLGDSLQASGLDKYKNITNTVLGQMTQVDAKAETAEINRYIDAVTKLQNILKQSARTGVKPSDTEVSGLEGIISGFEGKVSEAGDSASQAQKNAIERANNLRKIAQEQIANMRNAKSDRAGVASDAADTKRENDELERYIKNLKEYYSIKQADKKKEIEGKDTTKDVAAREKEKELLEQIDEYEAKIQQRRDSGAAISQDVEEALKKRQEYIKALDEAEKAYQERQSAKDQGQIDKQADKIKKRTEELKQQIDGLKDKNLFGDGFEKELENVKAKFEELSQKKLVGEDDIESAKQLQKEIEDAVKKISSNKNYQRASDASVAGLRAKSAKWLDKNTKPSELRDQMKAFNDELASGGAISAARLEEIRTGMANIEGQARETGESGKAFIDTLKGSFGNLARYLLSFASFYRVVGTIKQGVTIVKDLDTALTEMRKVSNESLKSLQEYQSQTFSMADKVGTTSKQLQLSTADWLRLGESFEEAQQSAQSSTLLMNVSEFGDINQATESLVSMSQAYKELDKMEIIDKLNNIGQWPNSIVICQVA